MLLGWLYGWVYICSFFQILITCSLKYLDNILCSFTLDSISMQIIHSPKPGWDGSPHPLIDMFNNHASACQLHLNCMTRGILHPIHFGVPGPYIFWDVSLLPKHQVRFLPWARPDNNTWLPCRPWPRPVGARQPSAFMPKCFQIYNLVCMFLMNMIIYYTTWCILLYLTFFYLVKQSFRYP